MFVEKIITKIGYLECTLPFPYFNKLLININNRVNGSKANHRLAGQIENEEDLSLDLIPENVKKIIKNGCHQYVEIFGLKEIKKFRNYDFQFESSWINFQKKGEYNPIHNHTGSLVFVIWLQIPYNLEDEYNHPSSINSNSKSASLFEFANISNQFTDGINSSIKIDKTYEGKMIIFPSDMDHTVYPFFTSDEYRISMSGNLHLVEKE